MATTSQVTIYKDVWTLLSTAVSGTVENQTGERIKINFADSLPAPSVVAGHVLAASESIQYNVNAGNVYARIADATITTGPVVITV